MMRRAEREEINRIAQCPYDYYADPQRTAYRALYADFSGGSNYPTTFCGR